MYLNKPSECQLPEGMVKIGECDSYVECEENASVPSDITLEKVILPSIPERRYKEADKYYIDVIVCHEYGEVEWGPAPCLDEEPRTYELAENALIVLGNCENADVPPTFTTETPESLLLWTDDQLNVFRCGEGVSGTFLTIANEKLVVGYRNYAF